MNLLLSYLESGEDNLGYGLALVAGVFGAELTRACSFSVFMIFGSQTGRYSFSWSHCQNVKKNVLKVIFGCLSKEFIHILVCKLFKQ